MFDFFATLQSRFTASAPPEVEPSVDPPDVDSTDSVVDEIVDLERAKAMIEARVMLLTADLADRAGGWIHPQDQRVADRLGAGNLASAELAPALHLAPVTAGLRVERALRMREFLPATLQVMADGNLDLGRVLAIDDATRFLTADDAGRVERMVLPKAVDQTAGELRAALRKAVIAVDPDGAEERRQAAVKGRRVTRYQRDDGTSALEAVLSAFDTGEIYDLVDEVARRTKTNEDSRSMDARRADAMVWLLLGRGPHLGPEDLGGPTTDLESANSDAAPARPDESTSPDEPTRGVSEPADATDPGDRSADAATEVEHDCEKCSDSRPADGRNIDRQPAADLNSDDLHDACRTNEREVDRAAGREDYADEDHARGGDAEPEYGDCRDEDQDDAGWRHSDLDDAEAQDAAWPCTDDADVGDAVWRHSELDSPDDVARHYTDRDDADEADPSWRHSDPGDADLDADLGAVRRRSLPDNADEDDESGWSQWPDAAAVAQRRADLNWIDQARAARGVRVGELAALARSAMTSRQPQRLRWVAINTTYRADGSVVRVGELEGYGPITTQAAEQLLAAGAARAPDPPSEREPTAEQAARHDPPDWLDQETRARDGTCRYPGCRQPSRRGDLDHTVRFPLGKTVPSNLGAMCRRHHRVKHSGAWRVSQDNHGVYTWTSAITGRTYSTYPRGTSGEWRGATTWVER